MLLIALLSVEATHPKVAEAVKLSAFANIGGKDGCYMFKDRILEHIHRLQDERRGKFAAFESALEYAPELIGMMHVAYALEMAENGESELHDPLRQSHLNGAEQVRKDLVKKLGTDLTVQDDTNPLYKTGGQPNMRKAKNVCSHRPWEFIWRVADGISAGVGREKPERWDAWVDRFLNKHLWTSKVA